MPVTVSNLTRTTGQANELHFIYTCDFVRCHILLFASPLGPLTYTDVPSKGRWLLRNSTVWPTCVYTSV